MEIARQGMLQTCQFVDYVKLLARYLLYVRAGDSCTTLASDQTVGEFAL